MSSSPFGLVRQLSYGPDGVRYLGIDHRDGADICIWRLILARDDPSRWFGICHRMGAVVGLAHRGIAPVRVWQPDGPEPYLVTDFVPDTLETRLGEFDRDRAVVFLLELGEALAEAHRLGLGHGSLCPSTVHLDGAGQPRLELFGLHTGAPPLTERDLSCLGPDGPIADPRPRDVYGLAMLGLLLLNGRAPQSCGATATTDEAVTQLADAGPPLSALFREMLAPEPEARPSMPEVLERLRRPDVSQLFTVLSPGVQTAAAETSDTATLGPGQRVGRFQLKAQLGEGGMGKVFHATDAADGREVALKVLHAHWSRDDEALRRFYREARLLSQLHNPHIAQFIDANEADGVHYLAMEFVRGRSLHEVVEERTRLPPDLALTVTRDVALALADVHDLGIIHRDIKPANILLVEDDASPRAKLCDFGIAREVASDQELTRAGLTVGTPHYMSPEQCVGGEVTAASDIYALGITLFKMLAGHVPFNAREAQAIVYKHLAEAVPDIQAICPEVDDGAARVLRRMLEKLPEARIQNARALLEELEGLRGANKTSIAAHPRLPVDAHDVITYDFEWPLESSPPELWPHVSHTERLNRAIGLGSVDFARSVDSRGQVNTHGRTKQAGMTLEWQEHPYEWVAPTRMGVLREYSAGPLAWLRSSVELLPRGRGTLLRHQIQVQPRGMLGKAAAAMEVGLKARRNLEAVYQRIDAMVQQQRSVPSSRGAGAPALQLVDDPFEQAPRLDAHVERRLATLASELGARVDAEVAAQLVDWVRRAPAQEVARIRPRAFAAKHGLDHRRVLEACLHGSKLGLLVMLWDIICPRCRIPSNIVESLEALREHAHCDACDWSFELDFAQSVEIMFRAAPELRDAELGTYCIGGPGHTPHVIMQIRLAPRERFEVELMLDEGSYQVTGKRLPLTWGFTVRSGAPLSRWEIRIGDEHLEGRSERPRSASSRPSQRELELTQPVAIESRRDARAGHRVIDAGRQRIVVCNDTDEEVVARIEREGERAFAMTAAEAAASAAFRELFPQQILAPGHLISVGRVTFLMADAALWASDDEAGAFARLTELARVVTAAVEAAGGAVVKLHGEGVMAAFNHPVAATRAALALVDRRVLDLRVAVHSGASLVTSINDRLDYFGRAVLATESLLCAVELGQAVISEATYADPEVAELLAAGGPTRVVMTQRLVGQVLGGGPVGAQRAAS